MYIRYNNAVASSTTIPSYNRIGNNNNSVTYSTTYKLLYTYTLAAST